MGISSNQIELLERILLNMRYNLDMTSKENSILVEQQVKKTTQEKLTSNIKLDKTISTFITRLSDEDLFKAANAWGWKNKVSQVYDKPTYDKLKKQSAASFLTKIRYPKFGPGNGIPANKRPPNITWGGVKDNQIIFTDLEKGIRQDKLQVVNPKLISKGIETTKQFRDPVKDYSNYANCLIKAKPTKYTTNLSVDELLTYQNRVEYCKANHDLPKFKSDLYFEPDDIHGVLGGISIITSLLALIPGPQRPFLNGVSLTADLVDATIYLMEDDPYMATMCFALALIPGGELLQYSKSLRKFGKKYVQQTAKKITMKTATQAEKNAIKEVAEELIEEGGKEYVQLTLKHAVLNFLKSLFLFKLQLLKNLIAWSLKSALKLGLGISKLTFKFLGIVFTFDMLYVAAYSDNKEFMTIRENSDIKKLIDLVTTGGIEFEKYVRTTIQNWFLNKVEEETNKGEEIDIFDFPNPDKETGAIDTSYAAQIVKKYETTIKKVEDTPKQTMDSLQAVITKGADEEIQNMTKKYEEMMKLQSTVTTQDTINK